MWIKTAVGTLLNMSRVEGVGLSEVDNPRRLTLVAFTGDVDTDICYGSHAYLKQQRDRLFAALSTRDGNQMEFCDEKEGT